MEASYSQATSLPPAAGSPKAEPKTIREVDFCELSDGSVLEMVEDANPNHACKYRFALFRNGLPEYVTQHKHENQVFVPIQKDIELLKHVNFPKGAAVPRSARQLVADISYVLKATLELDDADRILVAFFILSTWFVDKFPSAPYLAFVGPPGSGKTTALQVLRLLCRRSLLTSDLSSAAFYRLCDLVSPTLLIDETATVSNKRELLHLLRAGSTQGLISLRKQSAHKMYGARVVAWLELPNDPALNSRCLVIPMKSSMEQRVLSPLDPRLVGFAQKIQKALLLHRLENYTNLKVRHFPEEFELQPRTRDLYRALSFALGEDKWSNELLSLLLKKQESVRATLPLHHAATLEAVFELAHSDPRSNGGYRISYLTENVNEILHRNGEPAGLSEKKVSNILTTLHFTNRTRTNAGYVLWFDRKTVEQVHRLFHIYRANLTQSKRSNCELCTSASQPPADTARHTVDKEPQGEQRATGERGEHREHQKQERPGRSGSK